MKNIALKIRTIAVAICSLLLSTGAFAQQNITISGVVYGEANEPLIGASVLVEGTTRGTITDVEGKYTISAPKTAVLVFDYLGYTTEKVNVAGKNKVNVTLKAETVLDEIVVVGYATMKRSDLTGSVSSVSSKSIEGFKTGSVVEALGGQIAGVNITSTDGTPGASQEIKIRGVGTVTGDSSPLYIVDGFEVSDISYLANQDIKSVDVLKDASASAIYGARAANGVILITTKEGREGRSEVSYNGSMSFRALSKHLDVLSPYDFVALQMELNPSRYGQRYYQSGEDKEGVPYKYQSLEDYRTVEGVDWQDEAFRNTWSQSHDVSIMGGDKDTKYTASFSHFDEDGLFQANTFAKNSARLKFTQQVYKWMRFDASINYTNSLTTGVGTGGGTLSNIIQYRPTGGLFVSDYQLRYNTVDPTLEEVGLSNSNYFNPILNSEKVDQSKKIDQWIGNASLNVQLAKGLSFKSAFSYNEAFRRDDVFYREGSNMAYRTAGPYGNSKMQKQLRWTNNNVLTYKKTFAKKHNTQFVLGHEVSYNAVEFLYAESREFPLDDLGVNNLGMGAVPSFVESSKTDNKRLSFFARAFYDYDSRYMLTATLRADASTVFSANNKWGVFPSFAAAWNIAREDFMENTKDWLSNLKLRLGWGTVGNDRISNYLSLDLYNDHKIGMGSSQVTVLTPAQLANQNLRWEGSTTTNVGLDVSLYSGRINLTVDAFVKDSKDLLLAQNLSYVTGFGEQWQNVGKIRNKGIEFTLNTVNVNTKDFYWSTDLNVSFIRNTLVALQDGTDYILSRSGFNSNFSSYDYIAQVGKPIGSMYGYVFDGVYQYSDFDVYADGTLHLKEGVVDISEHATEAVAPGFVKYKDMDGDGVITTEDRTIIGNGQPDWFGGITNTLKYRNVDLSFMFQFSVGNEVYNAQRMWSTQSRLEMQNMLSEVADRWTATNASNKVPSAKGYVAYDVYSRFIEDGSFLRLKNITLGYTLPKHIVGKYHISNLRLYATAQNLWCLTNYSGYDPEVSMRSSNLMPAFDYGAYPKSKVVTFGVELKF